MMDDSDQAKCKQKREEREREGDEGAVYFFNAP